MPKVQPQLDVLVLGDHPSAYLAAALLQANSKLRVLHSTLPDDPSIDRLVLINPRLFELHKLLEPLRRKLPSASVYGTLFLADDPATRCEHHMKAAMAAITPLKEVRAAMAKMAAAQGVETIAPKTVHFHRLDERGLEVTLGKTHFKPRVLVLAGHLAEAQQKMLGLPETWDRDVIHRYTFAIAKAGPWLDLGNRPLVPMSLDLAGHLFWAWLLSFDGQVQVAVEQPLGMVSRIKPRQLLSHWVDILGKHGIIAGTPPFNLEAAASIDLPLAGALAHEGVANRTLLIGPAGGFYSATGEDIYPCCWSALFAADVIKKALKETHLQDALHPYRQKWRTTLGDYMRGPQQNLRFLLPLVYRNQIMTTRLSESILLGRNMMR